MILRPGELVFLSLEIFVARIDYHCKRADHSRRSKDLKEKCDARGEATSILGFRHLRGGDYLTDHHPGFDACEYRQTLASDCVVAGSVVDHCRVSEI
jgi:hypothetical protein